MAARFAAQARSVQAAVAKQQQRFAGGNQAGLQNIIQQMQAAQEKANLLNEQRFKRAMSQFENLGNAGRARIEQQTAQRQAAATQNLTSRGLGNTTITSSVERGIASDAETSRQQLEEGIAVQKAGLLERRSDVGPDLSQFASLLQAAGQGSPSRQVSTRIGPNLAAGRDVFGTPLSGSSGERANRAASQRRMDVLNAPRRAANQAAGARVAARFGGRGGNVFSNRSVIFS